MAKTGKTKASRKPAKAAAKAPAKKPAAKPAKITAAAAAAKVAEKPKKAAASASGLVQVSSTDKRPGKQAPTRNVEPVVKVKLAPPPPPAPAPVADEPPPLTEDQLRKVDTGLTRKDLQHYRDLLMQKRAEIIGDVESLQVDTKNNGGNLSHMPVHMADVGSDNYEQEFTLGLVESERKLLREIDDALVRIQKGYYGVCMERGIPINRARLDAKPWAKYCIEVVREMEKRGRF